MITRRQFIVGLGAAAAASFGLGGYALALEPRFRLVVTEWDLPTARWPHEQPLRIVIVTDIHACRPGCRRSASAAIVEKANALGGDIIVVLGDYVSGIGEQIRRRAASQPAEWGAALCRGSARRSACTRSWATTIGGRTRGREGARSREAGIPLYQNRAVKIEGAAPFWLAGTDSMVAHRLPGHGRFRGADDLPGTLAQITDDAPAILMAHEPDLFVNVPDRFAVTLSGHTHGGQVLAAVPRPAGRALRLRPALRLWPHPRGGARPDRLGRPRLLDHAGALRRSAGAHGRDAASRGGCRRLTLRGCAHAASKSP